MVGREFNSAKKKLPQILDKEQILRILKNVKTGYAAMAIFLGLFQGLRVSEFTHNPYAKKHIDNVLEWEDVDISCGEIMILDAKNPKRYRSGYGKDRVVPIFDELLHIFELWKSLNPGAKYVLSSQDDNKKPMRSRYVQDKIMAAIEEAGLLIIDLYQKNGRPRYKYHFHTFRHVCATNLLRKGLKIEQVKEFLGHAKIESTMIYLDLMKDDLKEAVTQAFAYPKQRNYYLPIKQETVQQASEIEALRLENENLKLKMQLNDALEVQNGHMPQQRL